MQGVVVAQGLDVIGSLLLLCSVSDLLTLPLYSMLHTSRFCSATNHMPG